MGRYLKIDDLFIDEELEKLLPTLTVEEAEGLERSVVKYGLLDPIKVWENPDDNKAYIIDGHNRYRIMKKHNIQWDCWHDVQFMYELETKEDVKRWMLEQQLSRRNLSDAEKYEIVQKFKDIFKQRGKKNQSNGGKGLSNLTKVNTRKEMAQATGVSESTYRKMDAVMQSSNEDLKQKLRDKQVSVDAAYKQIKGQKTSASPERQIVDLDKRINDIDKKITSLQDEKKNLVSQRISVFDTLDMKCPVKYRWLNKDKGTAYALWECQIYIEYNGYEDVFGNYNVFSDEFPNIYYRRRGRLECEEIPEKYRNDFRMVWKQAHDEITKLKAKYDKNFAEDMKKWGEHMNRFIQPTPIDKDILKKFYHVLAKAYHPDNNKNGDAEMARYVTVLKNQWGL